MAGCLNALIALFFFYLYTVMAAVGYFLLRGEKEGRAGIADIFD